VTVKDATGNESAGKTATLEVPVTKLVDTGPADLALLMVISVALSGLYFRFAPKKR
jgi:hypothetical protein